MPEFTPEIRFEGTVLYLFTVLYDLGFIPPHIHFIDSNRPNANTYVVPMSNALTQFSFTATKSYHRHARVGFIRLASPD